MKYAVFAFIAAVAVFVGWAIWETVTAPTAGTVLARDHTAPYTTTTTTCAGTRPVVCYPTTQHHPETWHLHLRDGGNTGWRGVDEVDHDTCHVGDHYPTCTQEGR